MTQCNFEAPNSQPSMLFAGLSQLLGEQLATQAWYQLRSVDMLRKTGDWTDERNKSVRIPRTLLGEPTLEAALQVLGLGTPAQLEMHLKYVKQWKLEGSRIPGTLHQYAGTKKLAVTMKEWMEQGPGEQYKSLLIRFNEQTKRIEITPRLSPGMVLRKEGSIILNSDNEIEEGPIGKGTKVSNGVYTGLITELSDNQVFVFGANSQGYHGQGSAAAAAGKVYNQYELKKMKGHQLKWTVIGEHSKISHGIEGKSYPMVTVEGELGKKDVGNRMPEDKIMNNIRSLYETALENPTMQFLVAYTPYERNRNGYKAKEMATMFIKAGPVPENIIFNKDFVSLMDNLPIRFIASDTTLQDQTLREPLAVDDTILRKARAAQFVEVRNPDGTKSGRFFDQFQQTQAVDSIIYLVSQAVNKYGTVNVGRIQEDVEQRFKLMLRIYQTRAAGKAIMVKNTEHYAHISPQQGAEWARNMEDVIYSLPDLIKSSLRRLATYGIQVNDLSQPGSSELLEDGELVMTEGKALENFNDLVFTLDPKATASGRLKLYIAATENVEEGPVIKPKVISIPLGHVYIDQIKRGERTSTVRTPDQLKDLGLTLNAGDAGSIKLGETWYVVKPSGVLNAEEAAAYNESEERENLDFMRRGPDGTEVPAPKHEAKAGDILLEITPYVQETGLVPIPSFIGVTTLAEFENLFDNVTGMLANNKPSFDKYIEILESGNPIMRKLAQRLKSSDTPEQIRREFVTVMTKAYTQYALIQYQLRPDNADVRTINANIYSARKLVRENWKQAQKRSPMVTRTESGYYIIDPVKIKELRTDYDNLKAARERYDQAKGSASTPLEKVFLKDAAALVRKMFTYNGIELTEAMYEELDKQTLGMYKEWAEKTNGEGNGRYSLFLLKLLNNTEEEGIENTLEKNNPLYSENSTMDLLSKVYVRHADMLYNSSHRDLAGNNVWDYTLNTYLSNTFLDLIDESGAYRTQLESADFSKHNWLLQLWKSDAASRRKADILYLEGLKKMNGKAASERTDMSDRDQLFMALGMYMNSGWNTSHYLSLTHSDKSRTPVFMNIPRTPTGKPEAPSAVLMERLYSVFESEFDRIVNSSKHTYTDHQQYEQGKKHFLLMPQFNYAEMVKQVDSKTLTAADLAQIWVAPGVLRESAKTTKEHKAVVDKMLNQFIEQETQIQLQKFIDAGIIDPVAQTHLFNKRYLSKVANKQANLSSPAKDKFIVGGRMVDAQTYFKALTDFVAMDFAMNAFLVNTSMVQLLYGDPAQVWKKSVAETLIEYEKRLAGPIAPGKETEWKDKFYNTIVLADYTVALDYIKGIPAYQDVNVTDAQEFVTMEEHLDVMFNFGMLAEQTYKEMLELVKNPAFEKFDNPEHEKIALQITKPVYYGKRTNVDRGALLHDYVKSSAIPLYAAYTKNTPLDQLRREMETKNIRRAQFVSAKKIGAAKPVEAFDKKGNFVSILDAPVQVLSRDGFRIQQEVPHDPYKDKIQIFSQANKLIISDLPADFNVTLMDGNTYNRSTIREKKEALRIQMLQENLREFKEELAIEEVDGTFRFTDHSKFIDRLIREGKKKNYSENELAPLTHLVEGKPISPLFFTSLSEPLHNLMMSMVDSVVKTKVPGKSYVQASSVGITQMVQGITSVAGIQWLPGYDESRELRMPVLNDDGTVTPAEILVPFHFFQNGKRMKLKDFMITNEKGEKMLDIARLPAEVLEMVGIRIPTSKHNTMLPMKIVGFLPENMADTIIVPPGITTQMGSDFDVDKLFVYRRPYTVSEGTAATIDGTEAEYFDLHFKILTNKGVYPMMMSPLDKPDLKEEAKKLQVASTVGNFFGASSQLADFLSQKDAKRLVGFGAQTNVFMAGIQPLDLKLGYMAYNEETEEMEEQLNPIEGLADEHGKALSLVNLSGYGKSTYTNDKGVTETRTKMDNINILLQEFLDHAKHRTIDKINLTVHTYPAAAGLLALETLEGDAVNATYVSRLLSQPIIRQFNTLMQWGEDMLSGYVPNLKETIFEQLYGELSDRMKGPITPEDVTTPFTAKMLLDLATRLKDTRAYHVAQYRLLRLFERLHEVGTRMSEMASISTQDVKGTDGSLFSVIDKYEKLDEVLGPNVILGGDAILYSNTEKGTIYDMVTGLSLNLFDEYLPHKQVFAHTLSHIKSLTNRKSMTQISEDIKKSVLKGLRSYVYSTAVHEALGVQDIGAERTRLLYTTPVGPSLAERVAEAQLSWGKDNAFLKRLHTDLGNGVEPNAVNFIAAKVTRMDDAENVRAWLDMLLSHNKEMRLLGEDLVRYAFLTGGVQDAQSFVRYVPFGYLAATNWFDVLQRSQRSMTSLLSSGVFTEQWFRHNPEKAISMSKDFEELGGDITDIPEVFNFKFPDPEAGPSEIEKKFIITIGGEKFFTPFISYRTPEGEVILYKKLIETKDDGANYARIDTLGNRVTDEYDITDPTPRSIITDNRAFNTAWQNSDTPVPQVQETGIGIRPLGQREIRKEPAIVHEIYTKTLGVTKELTDHTEINSVVIPHLLKSESLPKVYRTLLEQLHNFTGSNEFQYMISKMTRSGVMEATPGVPSTSSLLQLGFKEGYPSYSLPANTITLEKVKPGVQLTDNAETYVQESFTHELVHWSILPFIEYAHREATGAPMEVFADGLTPNSTVMQSARQIVKLWEFARVGNENEYWASSPHEFVTHATTNAETMRILNDMKYKGERSVLQTVLDFMNNLFNAISEFMGVSVKEGSVLAEALPHMMNVIKHGDGKVGPSQSVTLEYKGPPISGITLNAIPGAAPKKKTLSKEFTNMIRALEDSKDAIRESMRGLEDKAQREVKKLQLKKIDDDIQLIKDQANLHSIAAVGRRQLDWIRSVAESSTLQTPTDIQAAWKVSDTWSQMFSILYPDGTTGPVDQELALVSSTAEGLRRSLDGRARDAAVAMSEGKLTKIDFEEALKDMNGAAAFALSLNRSSSQLVQQIDLLLKNAGRNKEEDIKRLFHRLEGLEDMIKDIGGTKEEVYDMMMQTDEEGNGFGLVQKYAREWYSTLKELRESRKKRVGVISESSADKKTKAKNYKDAWDSYWKKIRRIGAYADITKLFDESGNYLADITAERNRLISELGSEEEADGAITRARDRYLMYLQDHEVYSGTVEQRMHEGLIDRSQADQEIAAHAEMYSPRRFFNAMNDAKQELQMNQGDRYAILSPKASQTRFYDEKYKHIKETPALDKVYTEYKAIMKELKGYLPVYVQWDLYDDFLPAVERHVLEDMGVKEYLASMGQKAVDSISATAFEEGQQQKKRIPLRYIYRDVNKEYSRDLIRITELFGMMALHYRHFAAIKDAVDMGETILKNIHIQRSEGRSDHEVLTNTLKSLEYAKDYLMYQKPRKLEGKTGTKIYSPNITVQRQMARKVKELLTQRADLEEELKDPGPGRTTLKIRSEMEELDNELSKYEDMGQNVYMSKLGDRLIGINQLKALAFNPFSGFANLAFGIASMSIYANGNKDFSMKTAMKALGMMTNSTRRYFTFGNSDNPVATKVMALMERTGIMGDVVDSQYGESNLKGRRSKLKKAIDPYTFLRSSDYYMKGSVLIATMLETQVEVSENGEKKTIPLWEAFDDTGKWKYDADSNWYSQDVTEQQSWHKFRNRAVRISQIVMGNMDKNSPKLMNKYILGRLIGQFRASWLPEGWAARWEDEKYDQQLGRAIKGRYRTYMDIGFEGSIKVMLRQFAGWFGNTDYFSGITMTNGKKLANSEVDMDNMRRNFTGMLWTLSMMAAILSLKALMPDDDDDESITKEALMIVLNMTNRVNQDLQFYASPDVANNLLRNSIPAFDVINDYMKAVKATEKAIRSEDYDWDQAALKWTKATPYLNQINRIRFMTKHDISTISR
jgi:hypothetical protein